MTTFRTKTGSVYEVDEPNRLIRQLYRPERRGGSQRLASGEWVDYLAVEHAGEGSCLWVWFRPDSNPVVTSPIVEVCGSSISD